MEILSQQTAIEQLLTAHFDGKVVLSQGAALNERTHVARFTVLEAPTNCPASLIVKSWRTWDDKAYDPDSNDPWSPSSLLFNDWAGLQLLSSVMGQASPAPRYIAGDRTVGVFVMEDLGSGIDPAQALLGDDPLQAEAQMIELAASLGRMHAATAGLQAEYKRLRGALGPLPAAETPRLAELVSQWRASLEKLGVGFQPGAEQELERVLQALKEPDVFLVYTHGDPCPDNWRQLDGRMRLFDFEIGGFRHALRDGVYGRIHFPTCWCVNRFPPELPLAMERAYRAELVKGIPAAADDRIFYSAVVEMCAFWVLETCEWRKPLVELLEEDHEWGIATLRQRVLLRLGIFSALTASLGYMEALGETAARLREFLLSRWPQEADAMPLYPAFR